MSPRKISLKQNRDLLPSPSVNCCRLAGNVTRSRDSKESPKVSRCKPAKGKDKASKKPYKREARRGMWCHI